MPEIPERTPQRIVQLDVLRIVAVLLVLGRHMGGFPVETHGKVLAYTGELWRRSGWVGVDLFFVLSGFLVSGVLFREYKARGSLDFKRFFIRRGFKIYPAFYLLILVTAAVHAAGERGLDYRSALAEIFFVQNYVGGLWAHTWSLAVEEHFYLLLPLGLILLSRRAGGRDPFRRLPQIFAAAAVALLLARALTAYVTGVERYAVLVATHLRLDSLFFGVLLSYFQHFRPHTLDVLRKHPWPVVAFALALFALPVLFPIETSILMNTAGLTLLYLGFGALMIVFLHWGPLVYFSGSGFGSFLGYLGSRSYSIYLWHLPMREWGGELLVWALGRKPPEAAAFVVYVAGSILLGLAMAKLVEFPALKLRDYLFPSPERKPSLQEPASGLGADTRPSEV